MKRSGVLHPELLDVIASAGHGDIVVLTDAGLRVPKEARRIDLALCCGTPSIVETVRAMASELVIEAAVVASEFEEWNPDVHRSTLEALPVTPTTVSHEALMADMEERALVYVKTGECTAYASVALICGVNYLDDALDQYERVHGHRPE